LLLIEAHGWGLGKTTATLVRTGSSPIPGFSDRFARPAGCLHVLQVWVNDLPVDYDIADNQVQCEAAGAAPVALYLQHPATPDPWPEGCVEVLRLRVMSWIYRGLKEDPATADRVYAQSTMMLTRRGRGRRRRCRRRRCACSGCGSSATRGGGSDAPVAHRPPGRLLWRRTGLDRQAPRRNRAGAGRRAAAVELASPRRRRPDAMPRPAELFPWFARRNETIRLPDD
jgi:hypothetical protein